jgi:hypothetical protein
MIKLYKQTFFDINTDTLFKSKRPPWEMIYNPHIRTIMCNLQKIYINIKQKNSARQFQIIKTFTEIGIVHTFEFQFIS